jgi:hypothetical protein
VYENLVCHLHYLSTLFHFPYRATVMTRAHGRAQITSSSTLQLSIKDRRNPPPLLGSSGDLELLGVGEYIH